LKRARRAGLLGALGVVGLGASSYVSWEDLTEAEWLYALATRFATVDGHRVHYPTPTAELAQALEGRAESAALRHLAEARLELGDRAGAVVAIERWAEAEGAAAWAETARWGAAHGDMALAFRAAAKGLPDLPSDEQRKLLDEQIDWADAHPEAADRLALRQTRATLFPGDGAVVEEWIRALEDAGKLAEADAAAQAASGMSAERRLLLRSDLLADHGDKKRAFELLDEALRASSVWTPDLRQAFAERTDGWSPGAPETWRATLDKAFDSPALLRLTSYFQGQGRGAAAADLLTQVGRRYETGLGRTELLLLARLHGEIDGVPEAFRNLLSAAERGTPAQQNDDMAGLVRLGLRAGGRPLAFGVYNDEPYRWIARIDRTPGFWTGGLSFLLTGQDWKEALARLEAESLPDRTFATARALLAELLRRAPNHPERDALRILVMARYVERGEGREALALLPGLEAGAPEVAAEARRIALLAARQSEVPLTEELRLAKARLASLAANGSLPRLSADAWSPRRPSTSSGRAWHRQMASPPVESYKDVLEGTIARLDQRDPSHRAAIGLMLGELDRLPDAEDLWSDLASRLEGWNLDDDLGPRYERALERFRGEDWWARAARWYARRSRQRDLDRLANELANRFRGAAIFARADGAPAVRFPAPGQPLAGSRVRLVLWADWVRLRALERFPQSPQVFREARGRLIARGAWEKIPPGKRDPGGGHAVVVEDNLLQERHWALLFADRDRREEFFAEAMRKGDLEARLRAMESAPARTPVDELLLFEGWSRLSRFEEAAAPAGRLSAAYPGNGTLARRVLSLHRSLAALQPGHGASAAALVARTAPALEDPNPLFTELGEMEVEAGHPDRARPIWNRILERDPRSPERVLELATLLWDYDLMKEALGVLEEGRRRLARPRLFAFEAGVLREEQRDAQGAVREYLNASLPDDDDPCFCSWFERDQRSLRRLAQLLGRDRVFGLVHREIARLKPGVKADERTLAALLPLAQIRPPDPDLDWTADDWIDGLDLPRDPMGRAARTEARAEWRPRFQAAMVRTGEALLDKVLEVMPRATEAAFLDTAEQWSGPLLDRRWAKDREVGFKGALLRRRAELAPSEEERVAREVERARYLLENGQEAEADAAWAALSPRILALPEGAPRMHAEADRAAYLERAKGKDTAAMEWARLSSRYAWSLGVLEDRVAFLARADRGAEGRALLESAVSRAATGHREALLERLTKEALHIGDLAQARRGVTRLLGDGVLAPEQRLGALHLLARLSLREDRHFDLVALARSEEPKLEDPRRADLYHTLAEAAEAEQADQAGVTLWLEALNRRLERPWLHAASRTATRAGQADTLRRFFEDQQARSPRDVRWAVAVREIRLDLGDLDGAIAMAKTAITVRPDLEGPWREAADLLVRAGRPREAADLLEGWQKPRPGDEEAARSRSALYAQAGDGARALKVEQDALAAYTRLLAPDEEGPQRVEERRGRALRRLLALGLPKQAFRLAVGSRGVTALAQSGLGSAGEAELALASGNLIAALNGRLGAEGFADAAARVLTERGRPEEKDEVLAWMTSQVLLPGTPPARSPQPAALRRVWPFARAAGMEHALRIAVTRRLIAESPGPWQAQPSPTFAEAVAEVVLGTNADSLVEFHEPPLEALFVRDLVRRGNDEGLWAFLEPRWREVVTRVRSGLPVSRTAPIAPWAVWLNDPDTMAAFARATSLRPERVADLAALLADRRLWDRLWAAAARDWNVGPLVSVLPEEARTAWFRNWQSPSALDPDPVLRARGEAVERVSVALAHLVEGRLSAAADPLISRLRGPRNVGDVLGSDPRWLWPELTNPAPAARGTDADDARVVGRGADKGRFPGALWGERPGAAWFVLETLARQRQGDVTAALVPAEQPERGGESDRGLLAMELAAASGEPALALALDQDLPGRGDRARFRDRLRLLVRLGRTDEARAAFELEVRRQQGAMNEAAFRGFWLLAGDLGLPDPIGLMDPATEVSPVLLAFLYDWRGPAAASRFRPRDPADFRTALTNRWRGRDASLSADAVRFSLAELWKNEAAPLPTAGLGRLGTPWPESAAWLARLRVHDREEGLAAIGAWPDATRLLALLARDPEPKSDVVRLLRLRLALSHGDDAPAVALLEEALREMGEGSALAYAPAVLRPQPLGSGEDSLEETGTEDQTASDEDPTTTRLRSWLEPFRAAKRLDLALARFEAALLSRRERGSVGAGEWGFGLDLSAPAPVPSATLEALERAWIRGDLTPASLGPVVQALTRRAPAEAPRWLLRWSRGTSLDEVAQRVRALLALGDKAGAARRLIEARASGTWDLADEVKAFDLWRRLVPAATETGAAAPPVAWSHALAFWTRKATEVGPDLAAHLRAHPFDVLAARAALRAVTPADEGSMRLAAAVLHDTPNGVLDDPTADVELLNLRAARGLLPTWPRAASEALGQRDGATTANELVRRRLPKADVDSALADVARIAMQGGSAQGADSALSSLDLRNPDLARAVRLEIRDGSKPAPPPGYRLASGIPAPYRPRDLGWPLIHGVLAAEGQR
jgi:hypothetical protein